MRIDGGKPQLIMLSLLIASNIAKKIYRCNLHVLEIPQNSNDEFVISDNPVVFLDMDRRDMMCFVPWWEIGTQDFIIFMPISPKKAVFYCKSKKKDGLIEKNNEDLVRLLNFGQYAYCSGKVFSTNREIIEKHLKIYR